jgi:hypothetical protein
MFVSIHPLLQKEQIQKSGAEDDNRFHFENDGSCGKNVSCMEMIVREWGIKERWNL